MSRLLCHLPWARLKEECGDSTFFFFCLYVEHFLMAGEYLRAQKISWRSPPHERLRVVPLDIILLVYFSVVLFCWFFFFTVVMFTWISCPFSAMLLYHLFVGNETNVRGMITEGITPKTSRWEHDFELELTVVVPRFIRGSLRMISNTMIVLTCVIFSRHRICCCTVLLQSVRRCTFLWKPHVSMSPRQPSTRRCHAD